MSVFKKYISQLLYGGTYVLDGDWPAAIPVVPAS